jgi:hypothetical protein
MKKINPLLRNLLLTTFISATLFTNSVQAQISPYYFNSSGFASSPWICRGQNPIPSDDQTVGIVYFPSVYK